MNTFLNFLNNASREQLSEIPGISPGLSQKIIDARPFDSVQSSLAVKGLGSNLLAKMEKRFEEMQPPDPGPEPFVEEPVSNQLAIPKLSEPIQAYEPRETPRRPNFGQRLGRAFSNIFKFLFRLLIAVVILGGIAAVFYFGIPLFQETILQPLSINTEQINQIATQQAEDLNKVNEQLSVIDTRLATLETSIETHSASIQQLEEMQAMLDQTIVDSQETVTGQLKYQLAVTYSLELIARARLYLSQSNFGIAKQDLQTARDKLSSLLESGLTETQIPLEEILTRLDMSIKYLPEFPVIAANDLEIAWLLLIEAASPNP